MTEQEFKAAWYLAKKNTEREISRRNFKTDLILQAFYLWCVACLLFFWWGWTHVHV